MRMLKQLICLILSLIFLLGGCSPIDSGGEVAPDPETEALKEELSAAMPVIDGSTATIPLTAALLEKILGTDGESALLDAKEMHKKTHTAILNVIDGAADIAFVTNPSEDELEYAANAGVEIEIIPVVKDAFVFLINIENPVKSLTVDQLRDIYSKQSPNWSDYGGDDADIIAYQRPVNSGSQTNMIEFMGDTPLADPPSEYVLAGMGDLVEAVSIYDNAKYSLGYSVFYYASEMYSYRESALLAVNGITPTAETIAAGDYPIVTYYYAVIRSSAAENSPERLLLEYLLGDEGQRLTEEAGYVPMAPLG